MGSLFDGIGGFPLAAVHNGITPLWASEIESFPIEVTKIRFPEMVHVGDITKLDGAKLQPVDVLCGGSPCQDLSIAGPRFGLAGERSGLFMHQVRIAKEMRKADEQRGIPAHLIRPRFLVWENVPGAFSGAEGEDFRAVLEEIVRITDSSAHVPRPDAGAWQPAGVIVLGDEFSLAWRVLDAQYWPRTPQRRKRIYLVADFGGSCAPAILFKQDSMLGDSAPGGGPWKGTAAPTQRGADDPGGACLTPDDREINVKTEKKTAVAFAANQRDEVRDLNDVAGALGAQPGMKQQTFVADTGCLNSWDTQQSRVFMPEGVAPTMTGADGGGGRNPVGLLLAAGFCAGAGPAAGGIGYQEECAPTLKASESGTNMVPAILCINDEGGKRIDLSHNISGTLRADEHGHQPLVMATQQGGAEIAEGVCPTITSAAGTSGNNQPVLFENHGIDSRYTGPHKVAPTMSARYGTGGNNQPLIAQPDEVICISGNTIDREPENGGNGLGCQADIAYTLTGADRHAVFSRQRSDIFLENNVTATQSARQHKDATDLVCDVAGLDCRNGNENGDLCGTLQSKTTGGYSLNNVHPVRTGKLIRRLTPLECERLQGYPDGWTNIPGASDSVRYKALGNSVAIPCVDFVLRGIAYFLRIIKNEKEENKSWDAGE
ncbi:MAG: cytosine methyltransferase [Clostridiales bacterium]|nr:cytosine methyltransferase [Clostridiales bacterium]